MYAQPEVEQEKESHDAALTIVELLQPPSPLLPIFLDLGYMYDPSAVSILIDVGRISCTQRRKRSKYWLNT